MADILRNWNQHRDSLIADLPGVELDAAGNVVGPPEERATQLTTDQLAQTAFVVCFKLLAAFEDVVAEVDQLRDEIDELRSAR